MSSYHLFSWGANSRGQLGLGNIDADEVLLPSEVDLTSINVNPEDIIKIVGGAGHSLFLDKFGSVYSCGWNNKGQAGCLETNSYFQKLTYLEGQKIVDVVCGWDSSMALTETDEVFVWGSNSHGQLGVKSLKIGGYTYKPLKIALDVKIQKIHMGLRHSALVTQDGRIFVSGAADKGQLGLDLQGARYSNIFVQVPNLCDINDVSCGQHHTAVVTKNNDLFSWGSNKHGQLGIDPTLHKMLSTPMKIENYENIVINQIYCGWTHSAILTSNERVLCWGRNTYGQLGRAQNTSMNECWKAKIMSHSAKIKRLAVGSEHNIALTDDGTVLSWGWNEHGNCGNGSTENISKPIRVSLPEGLGVLIGTGAGHSFAIMKMV